MPPDPDAQPPWVPHTDVFVNQAGEFVIKVELAALRREDLELKVQDHCLEIVGRRPDTDRSNESEYLVTEIDCGPFRRVVDVPASYDINSAVAEYQNGVLRVVVPGKRSDWRLRLR
jgi:HSP20 family protein